MDTESWGDRVLLIVEDHPDCARGLQRLVRYQRGPKTRVATDCRQAMAVLETERPIGAIVDVQLPDGSGLGLIPIARRAVPGIPILVLTGHSEERYANFAQALGAEFAFKAAGEGVAIAAFLARVAKRLNPGRIEEDARLELFALEKGLSQAGVEIVRLRLQGYRQREIAELRSVTLNTIKTEVKQILARTGLPRLEQVCNVVRRHRSGEQFRPC